jgi:phenylalanyl-tRNA synthetase alpha chain
MDTLEQLKSQLLGEIKQAVTLAALENVRVNALGKKGHLTLLMKELGQKTPEERKVLGAELNVLKDVLTQALDQRKTQLEEEGLNARLASETLDVSLPPRSWAQGKIHPLSHALDQVIHIFGQMGFVVAEGPDIEEDFYNFTALNIPLEHPARQEQDTFYLPASADDQQPLVLRTHTSPVQIRTMLKEKPPLRIIAPGRTYRNECDATHSPMFHQIEGLVVDTKTHMGHLKGCLEEFFRLFFENSDLKLRFRPGYFPFTEPSAEVDMQWKNGNWLELGGCGMVHPNVLRNCDIDPDEYQGFAFGMGIERITMLKYGIEDLRLFYKSDLRWLNHYGFEPEARE